MTKDWDLGESANLATTTWKGGEISMDSKPWEAVKLNLSYVYLLAKNDDTDEIPGRYIGDIRVERTWKELLVYLDVTNFLDKKYEKYYGSPGNERIFRLGVQWNF